MGGTLKTEEIVLIRDKVANALGMKRRIIVISDIHLGRLAKEKLESLREFLKTLTKNDILVLNGDIIDFLAEVADMEALNLYLELFNSLLCIVHYVVGNHDIIVQDWDLSNKHNQSLNLIVAGKKFYIEHGYRLECVAEFEIHDIKFYENLFRTGSSLKGWPAHFVWILWVIIKNIVRPRVAFRILRFPKRTVRMFRKAMELAEDLIRRAIMLNIPKDVFLIHGHLHEGAGVFQHSANCGAWIDYQTYIEIDSKGNVFLKKWNKKNHS